MSARARTRPFVGNARKRSAAPAAPPAAHPRPPAAAPDRGNPSGFVTKFALPSNQTLRLNAARHLSNKLWESNVVPETVRPRVADADFTTKFHLPSNQTLRLNAAKDQGGMFGGGTGQVGFGREAFVPEEWGKSEFLTKVGHTNNKWSNRMLVLKTSVDQADMRDGADIGSHKFREERAVPAGHAQFSTKCCYTKTLPDKALGTGERFPLLVGDEVLIKMKEEEERYQPWKKFDCVEEPPPLVRRTPRPARAPAAKTAPGGARKARASALARAAGLGLDDDDESRPRTAQWRIPTPSVHGSVPPSREASRLRPPSLDLFAL